MPVLKKGEIKVRATAYGTEVKSTGYVFYSYDKNSSALFFQFRNQNGEPTDIANAKIHLLMILEDDEGKEFIPGQEDFEIISKPGGKAKFVLPEMLLSYQGKVTGYINLDFEDGSHTDEGQFSFRIRRSMITRVLPAMGDKYVQDFEDIKAEVQEAANGAKETISQKVTEVSDTSDSAISKANQVADQAKSDVQSKASEASEDISGIVKTTEDARDNAKSQIGEYVGEVESAKDSTIEDIDKALPEVEGKLQDLQKEMIVGGRNYIRNSNLWASKEKVRMEIMRNKLTTGTYVLSVDIEIENADKKGTQGRLGAEAKLYLEDGTYQYLRCWYNPEQGESFKGRISSTVELAGKPKILGASYVYASLVNGDVVRAGLPKLERGKVPSDWAPAPEDYDAKIKKLEEAITNLGGSI